jgi:sn-glycerol 3-phosphate transport system substrate-binding protein
MPFNVSDPVLFYNKKVFVAAGLDPEKPPASLDDVRAYSQKIVDTGAAKYGLAVDSGFDSGGGWYIEQWFAQLGEFYANNDNGRTARATQVLYNNDTGVGLLTDVQQLIKDGLAVDVGDNAGGYDNLLKLADETEPAAMSIATSASLGPVIAILDGGQFPQIAATDVGVGPMPGPEGANGAIVGGASMWITDSGNDAKAAAAWDFLRYLTSAQSQSTFSAATGYIASRDDARSLDPLKTTLANDPRFAVALDQLNLIADSPTSAGPVLGPLKEVRTVTAQAVAQIFSGADAKSSLDAAAQQANALIADYNARNTG